MRFASLKTLALSCALCALAACSPGTAPALSGAAASPASTPAAQTSGGTGGHNTSRNPCDVITAANVAGTLTGPLKRDSYPGMTECQYETQSAHMSIIAMPLDNEMAWQVATTYSHITIPVAGVGDTALRSADGATLVARKGSTYCRIELVGGAAGNDRGEPLARKLGALCTKLFAAH